MNVAETDPNKCWKSIGKNGIKQNRKPVIPMEVYERHGSITGNVDNVLSKWKDDFASLFKNKAGFDDEVLASVKVKVQEYESEMNDIINDENVDVNTQGMNAHITHEEVRKALNHVKLGKSVRIDLVPTEVLRTGPVYPILVELFNMCFKYGITPSAWQKGIINPIPKSGITLTCHMYKIYCTILKFRLTKYLKDNNILVQEQSGFRKMRSCLDHIFSLISTIENRYKRRQSTFVCFVDMQKAFDTINRVCLMEQLRNIGVNGYMYNTIKKHV